MDIAFYLSELLGELGRVIVPGLGTFTKQKIAGYYNEQEAKFYPPGSEITFDPHFTDDDTFVAYVGQQKKISLASSKYFIDKYISKMKEEAVNRDIPFGELGSLHYEESGLSFTKAKTLKDDPAHYGYPQIELKKLETPSVLDHLETYEEAPLENTFEPGQTAEPVQETKTFDTAQDAVERPSVQQEEPVDFGSEMENYLRELEAGATIAGPETGPHQQAAEHEPVIQPELAGEPEPVIEPQSHTEDVVPDFPIDVVLPQYTPEPVIVEQTSEEHVPQPEPYIQPVAPVTTSADITHHEEEFVFDGKGYDDVDTRPSEKRSLTWLWIILGVIVVAAGVGGFIYYKHQQALKKYQSTAIKVKPALKPDTTKKVIIDSLNDDSAAKDSSQKAVVKDTSKKAAVASVVPSGTTTAIDSTKPRYEITAKTARTMAEANLMVTNYKSLGITDAHVLIPEPGMGRKLRVSLATFANKVDAINKERELLNTGNVRDLVIMKINPKK